ncbi:transmembrane protein 164 [Haematobia irritans]|uniref:transmembrane protein 164 n=1 Tax=Haematobia irritans TaxID=7368 RepID=UPI003F50A67C
MVWDWAVGGVTEEVPRTMGPECENYMTNRRRIIEAILFCIVFIIIIKWAMKRLEPIQLPDANKLNQPHSGMRIGLLLMMTLIFGIEMGFKLANRSVIFVLNPCHIQTLVQIYILAAKPSRTTTTLFRIQMNNLNGAFLAYIFPEVECRTLPFEQATYWIQHALLYIIPVYILRSGLYKVEDLRDFNWVIIGVEFQLLYHFSVLNICSMYTGINLNHMLCAAESDPFQGQNYRIAAVIHESILCPILNKLTVYLFATPQSIQYSTKSPGATTAASTIRSHQHHHQQQEMYEQLTLQSTTGNFSSLQSSTTTQHQHKPPTTCNKLYLKDDGTPSQLIHRNSISNRECPSTSYLQDDEYMLEQETPASAEYRMPTTKID